MPRPPLALQRAARENKLAALVTLVAAAPSASITPAVKKPAAKRKAKKSKARRASKPAAVPPPAVADAPAETFPV